MSRAESAPVVSHLRREQANAVVLYLQYKGYHWNVAGPLFRELHLLFDEHAGKVFESIDALAERQRMLGARAQYTLEETRAATVLPAEKEFPSTPREMLHRLIASHHVVIDGLHEGIRAADEHGDPGSADLMTTLVEEHQKMEWFLRESAYEPATEGEVGLGQRAPSAASVELSSPTPWKHPAPAIPERSPH